MSPTVVVTDAEWVASLVILRALDSAGWSTVAVSSKPGAPAFRSRHVSAARVVPDAERDPEGFATATLNTVDETDADLLIPATDAAALALFPQREKWPASVAVALPDQESFELARDKHRTLQLADELDVPTPRWRFAASWGDVGEAAFDLGWPVVLKPLRSHECVGGAVTTHPVVFATDPSHLREQRPQIPLPVLVQELVRGVGRGVELLVDKGRPVAAFQHLRIRETPLWGGMSSARVGERPDPEMLQHSLALVRELEWTGLAMIEFRSTAGGPRLMEINGRPWGSIALPVRSGVDFPRWFAELMLHGTAPDVPWPTPYAGGTMCHNLELELRWVVGALSHQSGPWGPTAVPRREAVAVVLNQLNPRHALDVQTWADPRPGLSDLIRIGRTIPREYLSRLVGRWAGRRSPQPHRAAMSGAGRVGRAS